MTKRTCYAAFLIASLVVTACGDDGSEPAADAQPGADAPGDLVVPETYTFESRFTPGESSVSYSGQVFRHTLIAELDAYINRLTQDIDTDQFTPVAGDVTAALNFYYEFDGTTSGQTPLTIETDPPLLQMVYADISGGATLRGKVAGNDPVGQHEDWTMAFTGWNEGAVTSPDELVLYWFSVLDALAVDRAQDVIPTDPDGNPIADVYVTASGQDLRELLGGFLLNSIAMSQAMDDYLDDATEDKGLLTSNLQDGDNPYSTLEHQWDEGFGYFGAARDYNDYTDDELAGQGGRPDRGNGYHDANGDGAIDLKAERNAGEAVKAAKRDRTSSQDAPTDFTKAIFDAFVTGRAIINAAAGTELTGAQMADLKAQRDIILENWERSSAANIVHYINNVIRDVDAFGTGSYSFSNHAKHWSQLKGVSLGLQFSPYSPLSGDQFNQLQELIGDAPVLSNAGAPAIDEHRSNLLAARTLIGETYGFDAANLGDENGQNGW